MIKFNTIKTAAPIFIIAGAVIFIFNFKFLSELLEFNRIFFPNEWWRLITAHYTHWNVEHLIYDTGMFILFGFLTLKINEKIFYIILFLVPLFASLIILIFKPYMMCYRGISGIDTALFTFTVLFFALKSLKNNEYKTFLFCFLAISALTLKTFYESLTGSAFFVSSGFTLEPFTHLTGIVVGCICIKFNSKQILSK